MILYQLRCSDGHEFEAWFRDAATYDKQSARHDVTCPICGTDEVSKAPMAPRLSKGAAKQSPKETHSQKMVERIFQAAEKMRKHVEENCEYVGQRFSEEARRIHYGESEERGIYGEATDREAAELSDEGVEVHQVPWIQRRND